METLRQPRPFNCTFIYLIYTNKNDFNFFVFVCFFFFPPSFLPKVDSATGRERRPLLSANSMPTGYDGRRRKDSQK